MVSLHSISELSPFPRAQKSRLPRDDALGYSYMPQRGRYEAVSDKLNTFLSMCQCHVCDKFRPDELLPLPSHYPSTGFARRNTSVVAIAMYYDSPHGQSDSSETKALIAVIVACWVVFMTAMYLAIDWVVQQVLPRSFMRKACRGSKTSRFWTMLEKYFTPMRTSYPWRLSKTGMITYSTKYLTD